MSWALICLMAGRYIGSFLSGYSQFTKGEFMSVPAVHRDITIVGAGPVGLYLAGLLGTMEFSVTVLEKKTSIDRHSKSLGIHPVSLELFDEAGIAERFTTAGLAIKNGHAFIDDHKTEPSHLMPALSRLITFWHCRNIKPRNYWRRGASLLVTSLFIAAQISHHLASKTITWILATRSMAAVRQ